MDTEPGLQAASLGAITSTCFPWERAAVAHLIFGSAFFGFRCTLAKSLKLRPWQHWGEEEKSACQGEPLPLVCRAAFLSPAGGGGEGGEGREHNTEGMAGTMCGKAIKFLLPALFFNGCLVLVPCTGALTAPTCSS